MQSDGADGGEADDHYFFFSAPASPVHYILRSPPSSTAPAAAAPDGDFFGAGAGDFEFAARAGGMSSAEDLFVAGRIRVGRLSPIRQADAALEDQDDADDEDDGRDARAAPRTRRARSASPPRSPRAGRVVADPSDPFASASSSSSSSSASSSSAKNTRRRISLRDLLTGTGCGDAGAENQRADAAGAGVTRSGFWPAAIWPSRSKKALLPCPAPQSGRRSTSSDRAAPAPAKKLPSGGGGARRTTSLPYRQGLVLGCLGFGARSYGLAKSMHPLYSR